MAPAIRPQPGGPLRRNCVSGRALKTMRCCDLNNGSVYAPQLVEKSASPLPRAEVARLHPPECPRAVPLAPCPPDRRDDGRLIAAAVDPQQPVTDRLDTARTELQDQVEHGLVASPRCPEPCPEPGRAPRLVGQPEVVRRFSAICARTRACFSCAVNSAVSMSKAAPSASTAVSRVRRSSTKFRSASPLARSASLPCSAASARARCKSAWGLTPNRRRSRTLRTALDLSERTNDSEGAVGSRLDADEGSTAAPNNRIVCRRAGGHKNERGDDDGGGLVCRRAGGHKTEGQGMRGLRIVCRRAGGHKNIGSCMLLELKVCHRAGGHKILPGQHQHCGSVCRRAGGHEIYAGERYLYQGSASCPPRVDLRISGWPPRRSSSERPACTAARG